MHAPHSRSAQLFPLDTATGRKAIMAKLSKMERNDRIRFQQLRLMIWFFSLLVAALLMTTAML